MFQVRETALGSIRYAGRSKAIVEDNVDPQKRGRIKVSHPMLGDDSVWLPYLTPPSMYSVPNIGDVVYVEAENGEHPFPVAWGNFTKKGGGAVPDTFLRAEPTNRGMYTPGNHIFEMDDGTGLAKADLGVRITTSGGHKFHMIDDVAQTNITLSDHLGNASKLDSLTQIWTWDMVIGTNFTIDGSTDALSMTTNFGDRISVAAVDGIQMSTPAAGGTAISMNTGKIEQSAALLWSAEDSAGAKVNLDGGLVAIGNSAGEVLDLFDQTLDILIALTTSMAKETHIGNLGYPSAPPSNVDDYIKATAELNDKIKAILALVKGSL